MQAKLNLELARLQLSEAENMPEEVKFSNDRFSERFEREARVVAAHSGLSAPETS